MKYVIKMYTKVYGRLSTTEIKGKFLTFEQAELYLKTLEPGEYRIVPDFNFMMPEDVKPNKRFYCIHPFYGMDEITPITGATLKNENSDGMWFKVSEGAFGWRSCCDAGMLEKPYNNWRSFESKEEAELYSEFAQTLPDVLERHNDHVEMCMYMDDWDYDHDL